MANQKTWIRNVICTCLLSLLLLATSCALRPSRLAPETTEIPPFRPPAIAATVSPTPKPTKQESKATSIPACTDQLNFVSDLTFPDGTVVDPSSTIDKRWEVENAGSCNWDANYKLRQIAGPDLGSLKEQALYPARSGSRATIRIVVTAPSDAGKYHLVWQAINPEGKPFGDPIYMDVVVSNP
jgi:hypothetical protein